MPFVGLVSDPRWEPPDDSPEPRRRRDWSWNRSWRVPWRALAWVTVWWTLLLLAPVAGRVFGGGIGYLVLLVDVALGSCGLNRWTSHRYERGLRDYQS
jgi:hypothetical protein